jgi:histidyl-tRNA synthetase
VRAYVEHSVHKLEPVTKWYYAGPMYRHERPQKGRYRQFHQFGAEALGFPGPDVDAELIVLCARIWRELGIGGLRLEINTIGSPAERARYRADLVKHFEAHRGELNADAMRRLQTNPLRILDSKDPGVRRVVAGAPALTGYLGGESQVHFDGLKRLLEAAGVDYTVNARLVRGLDYYNRTVFEWISDALGAQGTVCGGGRYDGLFEQIGGKPAPAAGFAMGNERLIALLREGGRALPALAPDAYVVHHGEETAAHALALAEELRGLGFGVVQHAGGGSFKSQMKKADASGALIALIVGVDELRDGEISVKLLRRERPQFRAARAGFGAAFDRALKEAKV